MKVLDNLLERVEKLERKQRESVIRGVVSQVDTALPALKVKYGPEHKLETDWLAPVTLRNGTHGKTWWLPETGEPVIVLAGGDLTMGVVLPATYFQGAALSDDPALCITQWSDGAMASYQRDDKVLTLTLPNGAVANITIPKQVNLTTELFHLNGRMHATGNISSDAEVIDSVRAMSADRTIYNGHKHQPTVPWTTLPDAKK